jgi:hypothetical protein
MHVQGLIENLHLEDFESRSPRKLVFKAPIDYVLKQIPIIHRIFALCLVINVVLLVVLVEERLAPNEIVRT